MVLFNLDKEIKVPLDGKRTLRHTRLAASQAYDLTPYD